MRPILSVPHSGIPENGTGVSSCELKRQAKYVEVLRVFSSDRGSTPRTSTSEAFVWRNGGFFLQRTTLTTMHPTILVVDDEKDILELLKYNLEKDGYRVLTARNGREALKLARQNPELVVLDIMMPELDGWEVCKAIRKDPATSKIPIIILTARDSEVDEVVGLELGADDYITKPVKVRTFLARVRRALKPRDVDLDQAASDVLTIGELAIHVNNYVVKIRGKELHLPKKEFEVLLFLARHPERVITRETLLNEIWGHDVYVVDRTIDVHIRKIREKLGDHAAHIETVKGVGYRFKKEL